MAAGTAIPPSAPRTGSMAVLLSLSSPRTTSLLISRPTTKKKIAMSPSLIQWRRSVPMLDVPIWREIGICHRESYDARRGEFAHRRAVPVATTMATPPAISVSRNSRNGHRRHEGEPVVLSRGSVELSGEDIPLLWSARSIRADQSSRLALGQPYSVAANPRRISPARPAAGRAGPISLRVHSAAQCAAHVTRNARSRRGTSAAAGRHRVRALPYNLLGIG